MKPGPRDKRMARAPQVKLTPSFSGGPRSVFRLSGSMSSDDFLDATKDACRKLNSAKAELAIVLRRYMDGVADRDYQYMGSEVGPELVLDQVSVLSSGTRRSSKRTSWIMPRRAHSPRSSSCSDGDPQIRPACRCPSPRRETQRTGVEKRNLDDGMCSMRLLMPALGAALTYDRIARALPNDDRTLDQKRCAVAMNLDGQGNLLPKGRCGSTSPFADPVTGRAKRAAMSTGRAPSGGSWSRPGTRRARRSDANSPRTAAIWTVAVL
ncbi:hypothetical protein SAMN04489726_2369 [Allokutzneria albata]|uniref:Uncharacterized protein n=1 Tax=Allokutzneria albata TaxID=211114 RepID=A0A1G9UEL8_ALLAB|nr:hypothetical protein SAMN04489726_2369 [Allokutzneria albata]